MAITAANAAPSYTGIFTRFQYEPNVGMELQLKGMQDVYDMTPMSNSMLQQVIGTGFSQFNLSDITRKANEQAALSERSKKAQELISVGDTVYTVQGGQLVEHTVTKLYADSLDTAEDIFFYEDVGREWFLTRRGALDHCPKKRREKHET